jgi:arylsulfatase A-like enzyme
MRGVSDLGQLARSIALPETLFFSADTSPALDSRNSANQRRDRQEQDSVVATEPQSEIPEPPLREEQEKLAETTGETKIEEQVDVSVETKTGNEQSPIPEETKAATDETTSEESHEPLNIILLYGDDWRHDSIGSAKASIVRTPFFDWLATQGMKFIHNCVTTSVCWISRATLYTGLYVSRHKSDYPHKPLWYEGWNDSWPQLLKEKGYYQGHSGKWHFDWRELVWSTFDFSNAFYGDHWYQENGRLIHTTKKNERDALKFLKNRPKDKPFMLSVCFFAPHSVDGTDEQYFPQNETMSLYENETVAVPVSATEEAWKKLPYFFGDINEGRRRWRIRFDTPEKHQRMMKNYFRLITEIDQTSEVIYKELVKQGVENKTMIIFTTDNGLYHSEHQLAGKWYPHQESIRVPLIIRDPRMPKDKIGTINEDFTLNIDLASTILGAAGVKQPSVMQGRDISDLYLKSAPKWRQEFFYEHPVHLDTRIIPASTALVRKKYKFMTWPDYKVEQLFDLEKDPLELDDLINSTDVADIISEMRIRHEELKQAALEPGPVDKSAKRIILQSRGAVDK